MRWTTALGMVAGTALAASAWASPRESYTATNIISDGSNNAVSVSHSFVGGYPVKYLTVNGTLAEINVGTFAHEAIIHVYGPNNVTFTLQPSQVVDFTGTTAVVNYVFELPNVVADAAGFWSFRFFEAFDDSGQDARWDTITFTLDDGPPAAKDLGSLNQGRTPFRQYAQTAGLVRWFKITLDNDVNAAASTYLDIDTEGTSLTADAFGVNDTEIGLYSSNGLLIANDDDNGNGFGSQLTFGSGSGRPGIGDGAPYNGRNGDLAAGSYYLAVGGFNMNFNSADWNVTSTGTQTGTINVNINTNTGDPTAPASYDLGRLDQTPIHRYNESLAAGTVDWYRIVVPAAINAGAGTYLDIDTEGSSFDTMIALYDSFGGVVSIDDDDGGGLRSQLTYGVGTRPAQGGLPYNGRDGSLNAGVYYIAVGRFFTAFNEGWSVVPGTNAAGPYQLNIRTNTGRPAQCPADIDDGSGRGVPDGGVTIDDLLYYLQRFTEGC